MLNDAGLKDAVLAELSWEPSVDPAHIGVTARDGVITLTGHVENYSQKHSAEAAARRVKGVTALAEELDIRLPYDVDRTDEVIAAAAAHQLAWNSSLPLGAVKATVHQGWVTLTGDVDWRFEQESAEEDVRRLWGVVGLTNEIRVKSRINTGDLTGEINRALHRSWFDPRRISVTAEGGKVKLTGTVKSWSDRALADSAAWAAPGATTVENNLIIAR